MARAREFLQVDISGLGASMGMVSGMGATIKTNRYADDVLKMTHAVLTEEFDLTMDVWARAAPDYFHHVYEWGTLGLPVGRLWKHDLVGHGASRSASWNWVASKRPVPSPQERADNPNDPMSQLDDEELSKFSGRRYFFYWKAPVMEYNTPVNIEPKNGKMIAFPVWDIEKPIRFSKGLRVMDPGGQNTTGAFTAAWVGWWNTEAQKRFSEIVQPVLEKDLDNVAQDTVRRGSRIRKKSVGLAVLKDYEQAFTLGEEWASLALKKKSSAYKRRFKE
jgi:hypothetical protein